MQNPLSPPLNNLAAIISRIQPALIDAMGVAGLKFIDDNFKTESFAGNKWAKRKKETKRSRGKKILSDTGTLRRSFTKSDGIDSTTIHTDIPYARIHNDGGTINHPSRSTDLSWNKKGRFARANTELQQRRITNSKRVTIGAHSTSMPQRQFIGNSPILHKAIVTAIKNEISKNIKISR